MLSQRAYKALSAVCIFLLVFITCPGQVIARREFPSSLYGIQVFNDQLPESMSEGQVQFSAQNYAGCQKVPHSTAQRLRSYNNNFLILHYRLGLGLGYQNNGSWVHYIRGDDWVREWPDSVEDQWFYQWSGSRVRNNSWGWYLIDPDNSSWRNWWTGRVLEELELNLDDGLFADSFSIPNFLGGSDYTPNLPDYDLSFENTWKEKIERYLRYLMNRFGGSYYLIPNVGSWITSRESTDYSIADGVMVEGFAADGENSFYALSDWKLQMNKILDLTRQGKAILCQPYLDNPDNENMRMFYLVSYLLAKGEHSYINIDIGYEPEYFPEYRIDLGPAQTGLPEDIDELYNSDWGVYVRRFQKGLVLLNNSSQTRTINLGGDYWLADPSGGGFVPESGDISSWGVNYTTTSTVSLAPHQGAILLNSEPSEAPDASIRRIWGNTSPDTSVAISQAGWNSSRVAVVARDDYFTDALAGGPLSYASSYYYGSAAPILLTGSHSLHPGVAAELIRLGVHKVYLLGGEGAVDSGVEQALRDTPGVSEVVRVWGNTSYGTAQAIKGEIDNLCDLGGRARPDTAVITTGENFPDALAISGPAASKNMPILLAKPFRGDPQPETEVALSGIANTVIVGGPGAIHPDLEAWLNQNGYPVTTRLWGLSEYDTAVAITSEGESLFSFNRANVLVTRGDFFTDGLAGGAYASSLGPAPTLLVRPDSLPEISKQWLSLYRGSLSQVLILGGTGAISQSVEDEIEETVSN